MTTSGAELVFGSLPLLTSAPQDADFTIEALGEGTDWGNPAAVVASVASMLMDGDKSRINRYGNREVTIPLQIRGATLDIVAAGEAAVMAEVNKGGNTLTWTPPGWSTPGVYDVVYANIPTFELVDLDELRVTRKFTLVLECLPFVRPAELTTVVAEPVIDDPDTTMINDCTSLTGWTIDGGALTLTGDGIATNATTSSGVVRVELTGPIAIPPGQFLVVELSFERFEDFAADAFAGSLVTQLVAVWTQYAGSGGSLRYRIYYPASSAAPSFSPLILFTSATVIHSVELSDGLPGSGRQRGFLVKVDGTARTQADLIMEAVDGSLGDGTMVYTAPQGSAISPAMRQWLTDASPSLDETAVSGRYHSATTGTYVTPAAALAESTYLMVARVKRSSGSGDTAISWTASLDAALASTDTDQAGSVTVPLTTSYKSVELGVLTLPPAGVDASSTANVEIEVRGSFVIDEVWLFDLDHGVLSWVNAGSASKFEVRSATVDRPRPAWVLGMAGTDASNVRVMDWDRLLSPGIHDFAPGMLSVWVVSPATTATRVTAELYPRFAHHVPPKAA